MLGVDVKRGVEATLERVFQNTGRHFDTLNVRWSGKTTGIVFKNKYGNVHADIVFPAIDETKDIDRDRFNQLIGYALHELGHAWFTNNEPWDEARMKHGAFVSGLINGLEDPRIEQCVIKSGYAPNSRALFENLINQILLKSGHVEGDDLGNVPFLLAVEGRRLNGYAICMPNPIDSSPYAEHLNWALEEAHKAENTQRVVEVAIELHRRLQQAFDQPEPRPEPQPEPGNPGDSSNPKPGDEEDDGEDGQGQGQGEDGDPADGNPADGNPGKDGKNGKDGKDDKPSKSGKNKGKFPDEPDRDVEPTEFINDQLEDAKCIADENRDRPNVGKPIIKQIFFED